MVGKRIRELRKQKGLTLRELSDELKIPFTTIGNYEREDRQPNIETLVSIANFFEVSIDYLIARRAKNMGVKIFKTALDYVNWWNCEALRGWEVVSVVAFNNELVVTYKMYD